MLEFLMSPAIYNFLRGPLVWVTFIILIGGSIYKTYRMVSMIKKEKVVLPYMSLRYGTRSLLHWIIPFGSIGWRRRPFVTIFTFVFHTGVIFIPIFLYAHNALWYESWGISWWTLSEIVADVWTIFVIISCLFLIGRRLFDPTVRFVTNYSDFVFIFICLFTFLTGFLAHYQLILPYRAMLNLHILFGEIMLILIPFTRLSHMIYFWFTRSYIGSEFGQVRHVKDY